MALSLRHGGRPIDLYMLHIPVPIQSYIRTLGVATGQVNQNFVYSYESGLQLRRNTHILSKLYSRFPKRIRVKKSYHLNLDSEKL